MLILKNRFAVALLSASLFLVSCENGRELALAKSKTHHTNKAQNPKFIDDLTVGGNAKSGNIKTAIAKTEIAASEAPVVSTIGTSPAENMVYSTGNLTEDKFLSTKYSLILGILPNTITNLPLYNFIDEWYGTEYRYGGKSKSGIDCSAFVQRLYDQVFGTPVVRTACDQYNSCAAVVHDQSELKEGDLVFFKIKSRRISHVGVYLANNYFVHASSSQGVMISNLNESYWSRYFAGAGKM